MNALIKPAELLNLSGKAVIIDARTGTAAHNGLDARTRYENLHLGGALFVDLETELADIKENLADGGRHPLPEPKAFARLLGDLGIGPETSVVVYDDKNGGSAAARFWWMLRAAGHEKVGVVDGGMHAAVKAGLPLSSDVPSQEKLPPYPFEQWLLPTVTMEQVERMATDTTFLVIDVREAERYRGETEPYDPVAGHIPGAVNIPYTGNLDPNGFFLDPKQLKEKYRKALGGRPAENTVVHCGSGVTACHTLLAMEVAGLGIPILYPGSFSEWCRNHKPIKP
jgi:thiosulfate/3-mercaptopyruvate sulfurtransferase